MDTHFIKGIPFFSNLSDEKLQLVLAAFEPRMFQTGETVMRQGDEADGLYAIIFGEVDVSVDGKSIARLGNNEYFGEMALVANEPRNATIRVESESLSTLFLSKASFEKIKAELGDDVRQEILRRITENFGK